MRLIARHPTAPIVFRPEKEAVFGAFFRLTLRSLGPPAGQSFRGCHGLKDTIRWSLHCKLLDNIRHGTGLLIMMLIPARKKDCKLKCKPGSVVETRAMHSSNSIGRS